MSSTSTSAMFEECVARFEAAWHVTRCPGIEDFLPRDSDLRDVVLRELVAVDHDLRRYYGLPTDPEEYVRQFPELTLDMHLPEQTTIARETRPSIDDMRDSVGQKLSLQSHFGSPRDHIRGGLGDILVVEDQGLQRTVVIKQLQPRWRGSVRAREAFLREVELTSYLEHPGVVPIHSTGTTASGLPCYSMRYVQGETLNQAIARFHIAADFRSTDFRDLLNHFSSVCRTIAYAHSRGIIHRDLKPDNIMIGPFGETLVLDWGLAKRVSGAESVDHGGSHAAGAGASTTAPAGAGGDSLHVSISREQESQAANDRTMLGDVIGSPAYLSPEQARGANDQVGIAADIFGLGAMLYSLLTGAAPFRSESTGESVRLAAQVRFTAPAKLIPSVPKQLNAICCKAMQALPGNRYKDAIEFARDVDNWLAGEPVSAMKDSAARRFTRFAGRRKTLVWAVTGAAGLLVLTMLLSGVQITHERHQRELADQAAEIRRESAAQISRYLVKTFQTSDPMRFEGAGFVGAENLVSADTFRRMLESGYSLIQDHLTQEPSIRADLLLSLGNAYRGLGDFVRARTLILEAYELRKMLHAAEEEPVLECVYHLARLAQDEGDYKCAEVLYRELIAARNRLDPPQPLLVADAEYHLAWLLFYQPFSLELPQFQSPSVEESIRLFEHVLDLRQAHLPPNDRSIGLTWAGLASARLCMPDQTTTAAMCAVRAMDIFRSSGQESALGSFLVDYMRAESLRRTQDFEGAETLYCQLKEQACQFLGRNHPVLVMHLWNMAGLYRKFGAEEKAEAVISELREIAAPLAAVRSSAMHVDGLVQYAEALRVRGSEKCREVCEEALKFANERPDINQGSIIRLNAVLDTLHTAIPDDAL